MRRTATAFAAAIFTGALASAAMAQSAPPNTDINQAEIANFNHFLDGNPQLAQQLAANPGLVNDPQFLGSHPGLQNFLSDHRGVNEELHESPGQFLNREGHFEWSRGGGPIAAAPGTLAGPVARFDNEYLDQHPEVAQQLEKDPRLIDNQQYLAKHPSLANYLANHPEVRQEIDQHPDRFLADERRDDSFGRRHRQGGITRGEVAGFDEGYLDQHPEVAEALAKDPRLVDNPEFRENHPGLDKYLAAHPGIRTELQRHPDRFLADERRFEHHEGESATPVANADKYLDRHREVAAQLNRDPRLIDDPKYVTSHPGLHEFLENHPNARAQWKSHPDRFTKREQRYDQKH